jgi:3-oxosteroid 1-dehydrogenase
MQLDRTAADVVVLGTGAAGLTAALAAHDGGASVLVLEKSDTVGGTSAWSGGMIWIPLNHHVAEAGIEDSEDQVLTYLASMSHDLIDPELAAAYVLTGPAMVSWLEQTTPARFQIIPGFVDYHPEQPGAARAGGRSLEVPLFPFDSLGDWQHRVTVGPQLSGNILMSETSLGRGAPGGVPADELARRRVHDERGAGQGLMGALLKGCLDRGIELPTGCRAVSLVTATGEPAGGRRVTGVVVETEAGRVEVVARRGVEAPPGVLPATAPPCATATGAPAPGSGHDQDVVILAGEGLPSEAIRPREGGAGAGRRRGRRLQARRFIATLPPRSRGRPGRGSAGRPAGRRRRRGGRRGRVR